MRVLAVINDKILQKDCLEGLCANFCRKIVRVLAIVLLTKCEDGGKA